MSHYLPPLSFNTHVNYEKLHLFILTAPPDSLAEQAIRELEKIHKIVPLQYYTCKCFGGDTAWYFAYSTKGDRDFVRLEASIRIREIEKNAGVSKGNTVPDEIFNLIEALPYGCACPFQRGK
jgi:hypothetical protein